MTEFHTHAAHYDAGVRTNVPAYDRLQQAVCDATDALDIERFLDLGAGSGVTTLAICERHPDASAVLLDGSEAMLERAEERVPADRVESIIVGDMATTLPEGPFDAVVSVLAVHHLPAEAKRHLFERVTELLRPGGRFVLGDLIIPDRPEDSVTPLVEGSDRPDRREDLVGWLADAGLSPRVVWSERDLVVIQGDT